LRLTRLLIVVFSVFAASVLVGCGGGSGGRGDDGGGSGEGSSIEGGGTTRGAASGEVTVFAASSLTDAFDELIGRFEGRNPGATVRPSYAGSSELLAQIQQGAPADVFASASETQMDTAVEEDLVGEPAVFARNRPVVIVPVDNPAGIEEFRDLATADAQLVLAQEGVPIADYTVEILADAEAEYGGGFEQAVLDKIVAREANVRAAANKVALGEADATFVYTSDVTTDIEDRVRIVEIPEGVNVTATYPIAAASESQNPELAQAWVDLVLSEEGQCVLEENGFLPAG
jgi:molybdate transport system substrate-binding protein